MSQFAPSPRETEVLEHLLAGETTVEIAGALMLSTHTVANYLKRLRARYGARHTLALVALVWERRHQELAKQLAECERVRAALDRRGRS